jgi:maleylpyruvate isomerase
VHAARSPSLVSLVTSEVAPKADLRRVDDAQRRFLKTIERLDDETARRPSLLPGWSVGHILSHVARNAESHVRRARAGAAGAVVDQYPGGYAGRTAEIDKGANRPAVALIADVHDTARQLQDVWDGLPPDAWDAVTRDVSGRERPLRELPARRWQELEVHLVDLDVGITYREWSKDFVETWLPRLRTSLASRLAEGAETPDLSVLDDRDELAWLYGRLTRDDLPRLAPWG